MKFAALFLRPWKMVSHPPWWINSLIMVYKWCDLRIFWQSWPATTWPSPRRRSWRGRPRPRAGISARSCKRGEKSKYIIGINAKHGSIKNCSCFLSHDARGNKSFPTISCHESVRTSSRYKWGIRFFPRVLSVLITIKKPNFFFSVFSNVFWVLRKKEWEKSVAKQTESTRAVASFLRPTPIILGLFCFCFLSARRGEGDIFQRVQHLLLAWQQ